MGGKTIVLVGCGRKKGRKRTWADQLYTGLLFRLNLRYAWSLRPDAIYILSARHHLVDCNNNRTLAPYDQTLNKMGRSQSRDWGISVREQLQQLSNPQKDHYIFLAGKKYYTPLIEYLSSYEIPMEGLRIGEQQKRLGRRLAANTKSNRACRRLHRLCRKWTRYSFKQFDPKLLPTNGVYLVFEKGEKGHGGDRIVRIGSHTGQDNLRRRLKTHPRDRGASIFRNHIGDILIINQSGDEELLEPCGHKAALRTWDKEDLRVLDKQISEHIRDRFSFVVVEENSKRKRLALERDLIATVAHCTHCTASKDWPGRDSPKRKIRLSGLWQIEHLNAKPMTPQEVINLKRNLQK